MSYIAFIFIAMGLGFIISGIVGLFRFPDFYSKLHAAGVIECCGIPCCLIGLCFLQETSGACGKLLLLIVFIIILNPVSTHILARAAVVNKFGR